MAFSCFIADRQQADPIARFGTSWAAYAKLAEQLIVGSIRRYELLTVPADHYSTPDSVHFEEDLREAVNRRLKRLAVLTVCRLDSSSTDALQIVDLLTSAVAFEFRQSAGLAGKKSPKARLATFVRREFGVSSCLTGCRTDRLNVATYDGLARRRRAMKAVPE